MTFRDEMISLGACDEGLEWLGDRSRTEYWRDCERADWMLWELSRRLDRRDMIGLCGKLAATVSHIYNSKYPNDSRITDCIQATQDYAAGIIDDEELEKFRKDADAAAYEDDDDDAATYAAYATTYAAATATAIAIATAYAAATAAATAAYATYAATYDATYAAAIARKKQHKLMCEIIRKEIREI